MDTTDKRTLSGGQEDHYEERGLWPWVRRNRWLLTRLFTVIVFSFAASTVAANFSYGLEGKPTVLSVDHLNSGKLPAGTELGAYVQVSGKACRGTSRTPASGSGTASSKPWAP